jgi:hypothetical protein
MNSGRAAIEQGEMSPAAPDFGWGLRRGEARHARHSDRTCSAPPDSLPSTRQCTPLQHPAERAFLPAG